MKNLTTYLFLAILFSVVIIGGVLLSNQKADDYITIAILAKDKAHTLPTYLDTIEKQTWPANKTYLYVRTNNNNDNTTDVLRNWIAKVGHRYAGVYFDDTDVKESIQQYKQHEWNPTRFSVLARIRQDSVDWARAHNSHYFVADCDNFLKANTIEKLHSVNLPIVSPFMKVSDERFYSNYHSAIDQDGYYSHIPLYMEIWTGNVRGLTQQPVVHCSYFIRNEVLDKIAYSDGTPRHEYVIFSDNARKHNIPQYLDNRELYGRITFAETSEDFEKEPWIAEFVTK